MNKKKQIYNYNNNKIYRITILYICNILLKLKFLILIYRKLTDLFQINENENIFLLNIELIYFVKKFKNFILITIPCL